MKCLNKWKWVKLPRDIDPDGKGLMGYYRCLATRVVFRMGIAHYCGVENPVLPGMWSGSIVGVKSILGVKSRRKAFKILETLGKRWGWEKTKVYRFFKKYGEYFRLYRLPASYGCVIFNQHYPT